MPSLTRPVLGVKHSTTELCVFCSFYALRGSTTLFNKWFESKTKSEGHKSMLAVVSRSVKSRGRVVHDCQNEIKSRVVDPRRSIVPQYTPSFSSPCKPFLLFFLSSQPILVHSLVITMFKVLRRISSSIYPRLDRPWGDDGMSHPFPSRSSRCLMKSQ